MEWDHWPNEGYPCRECGQRFECNADCRVRENDPPKVDRCVECKAELPGHTVWPKRCSFASKK